MGHPPCGRLRAGSRLQRYPPIESYLKERHQAHSGRLSDLALRLLTQVFLSRFSLTAAIGREIQLFTFGAREKEKVGAPCAGFARGDFSYAEGTETILRSGAFTFSDLQLPSAAAAAEYGSGQECLCECARGYSRATWSFGGRICGNAGPRPSADRRTY